MTTEHKAGRFTVRIDHATCGIEIEGPAEYLATDRYARRTAAIEAGTDMLFNMASAQGSPVGVAIAVSLQTDFAAWDGTRRMLAGLVTA